MPRQPAHYALAIGINDYPGYGSRRTLKGAVKDARRFATWLRNQNTGGGLDPGNCELIVSSENPPRPLREEIDKALERIWNKAKANGGDRFYFYFSGHGLSAESDNVALCLANWSSNRRHAALSSNEYLKFLKKCTPFKEIIVFLDCCRVRGVIGLRSELDCAEPIDGSGDKRHLIGYAAEFDRSAFEAPATPGGPGDEVRGHFTEALLAALSGGAARPTGGVTAAALKDYLEKNVEQIARASGHKQIPQVPFDLPADTVFGSAMPLANCEIRFSAARAGTILLEGPELDVIRRADAATGPWLVALRPGLYCLTEVATGATHYFPFRPTETFNHVTF